jgi:hypothetical protein
MSAMVPVCCRVPEVAVTVTVACTGGGGVGDDPPPQPEAGANPANVNTTNSTAQIRLRLFQPSRNIVAANAVSGRNGAERRCKAPTVLLAASANCVVIALPEGVTCCGLKLQVTPDGSPVQAKLTAESNPFAGVTVTVTVPWPPDWMVSDAGEMLMVKLGAGRLIVNVAEPILLFV